MGIFVTITTAVFFVHFTFSLIGTKRCSSMGRNAPTETLLCSLTSFRGRTSFPLFLMLSLSFKSNYDFITVLILIANCEIGLFLAKILSYAPHAGFPHFLCRYYAARGTDQPTLGGG